MLGRRNKAYLVEIYVSWDGLMGKGREGRGIEEVFFPFFGAGIK